MGLIAELKRRNVFRVAIAYVVFAWVLAQVSGLAFESFGAPEWVPKSVLFLLVLGLPIAIFFAWAFEMTPEGIKKERDVDRSQSITQKTGRKLDFVIIAVLVVAVGFLSIDKFGSPTDSDLSGAVTVTTGTPSIAVLPFDNRSNREEDQFFTDGIHDDLLTTIAKIGSMKVISRTSVMEYKGTTKKIPVIANELGVANILEGGIQRSGNQVRINVQLIDAATDQHLWAEIYDRELTAENLFAIQSEVSNAIAAALHTALTPDEAQRINAVPTNNLEAYETYLLGRERWRTRTVDSLTESLELFETATRLDPNFALAWVGISDAYQLITVYVGLELDEALTNADAALQNAFRLDGQSGEAYTSLGGLHHSRFEYAESEIAYKKAIELSPNYGTAYHWNSMLLQDLNKYDESREMIEKALELDPLNPVLHVNLGNVMDNQGEFDAARAQYERIIEIDPESIFGYQGLSGHHYFVTGHLDESLSWSLKVVDADPKSPVNLAFIAWTYLDLGDPVKAKTWIEKALDVMPDHEYSILVAALHATFVADEGKARDNFLKLAGVNSGLIDPDFAAEFFARDGKSPESVSNALAMYEKSYPGIVESGAILVTSLNTRAAINVAALLLESGETQRAHELLDRVYANTETRPMMGFYGYGYNRAKIALLRGDKQRSLAELTKVIDAGWRDLWWYEFDHSLVFEPLRDDPEFKALRARVAADMAEQLANVNKKESQSFVY